MSDILQVVGGVMLICIPVSLIMSLAYTGESYPGDDEAFFFSWFAAYFMVLLFAAVTFVGIAGVAMLVGAFR